MTTRQQQIIRGITHKLASTLPQGGHAMLYGSQARGDNHQGSDWDILILLDTPVSLAENSAITYPLIMMGWEMNEEINPVVYTKQEWASYKDTPFYDNVERDGILIA